MRIIAGQHKGRRLLRPKSMTTRPITSRVKVALFNILGDAVANAVVADLFSGTGSIGLEALSRGAKFCFFAECDRQALDRLKRNIEVMDLADRCRVWRGDILRHLRRWIEEANEPIDLAFVDPPYALSERWHWVQVVEKLFAPLAAKMADDGLVVFRCRRNIVLPDTFTPLSVSQRRDYGDMSLVFLHPCQKKAGEEMSKPWSPTDSGAAPHRDPHI
ncbi:MAG: 16S rRNA (guanine(966)-N(2))-methyltransferase RsmD [Phycisphaerae bacterium]|nr:16S rRNA (guanine(966)-N(2))-methyltransferase RsmD [Phycisphaerae bacterium]